NRHRLVMRLPREPVFGHTFEQTTGRAHFVIELRDENVFQRHRDSLPQSPWSARCRGPGHGAQCDDECPRRSMREGAAPSTMPMHSARCTAAWLLLLCTLVVACGRSDHATPPPPASLPPISGSFAVSGIGAPVSIVRDRWGIPHITAANQDDLFFAQGFVQA